MQDFTTEPEWDNSQGGHEVRHAQNPRNPQEELVCVHLRVEVCASTSDLPGTPELLTRQAPVPQHKAFPCGKHLKRADLKSCTHGSSQHDVARRTRKC